MTSAERASSLQADRPWLMLACGLFGALTVIGSGLTGSPLSGLAASIVSVVSWRFRIRIGLASAAAGAAALLYGDPWLDRASTSVVLARLAAPLVCAAVAGALYRRGIARNGPAGAARASGPRALSGDARARTEDERIRRPRDDQSDAALELDIVQRFIRDMRTTLGADEVLLWRSNVAGGEVHLFASSAGSVNTGHLSTTPSVDSLLAWAAEQRMVAGNSDADAALFLAAPLAADERMLGVLGVYAGDRRTMDRDGTKTELMRYAERAATLLDLLAGGRSTQRYRARLGVLLKAAERIQNAPDMAALGQTICQVAIEASGTCRAAFVLWDDAGTTGRVVTTSASHPLQAGLQVTPESLVGTACRERQRFAIGEAQRMSPEYPLYANGEHRRPLSSIAVVPMMRGRTVLGAIVVEDDELGQVTHVEADTLGLLASVAAVALENILRLETVRERASRDSLTGLPNRGVFDEQLRQRLLESDRFEQPLSLVLLDIDHFKSVNDRYGHDAGDIVLVAVARAVGRTIRNIDLCARYGGEELALLLPQTGLMAAHEVAERVRQVIAALEIPIGGRTITVTASVGVSCYPQGAATHEGLFTGADQALYAAKASGRNCTRSSSATVNRGTT